MIMGRSAMGFRGVPEKVDELIRNNPELAMCYLLDAYGPVDLLKQLASICLADADLATDKRNCDLAARYQVTYEIMFQTAVILEFTWKKRWTRERYHEYLLSPEWKATRDERVKAAGGRCQVCNRAERLNVHHRTYERIGDELPGDLFVLCEECHHIFHQNGRLARPPAELPIDDGSF